MRGTQVAWHFLHRDLQGMDWGLRQERERVRERDRERETDSVRPSSAGRRRSGQREAETAPAGDFPQALAGPPLFLERVITLFRNSKPE